MEKPEGESTSLTDHTTPISYQWPLIHVPNTSLARFIVEKFLFYSQQIFLVDGSSEKTFLYHHVLLDSLRVIEVLRSKGISCHSTLGIVGRDDYEHVTTLLAALLMETTVVLLDATLTNGDPTQHNLPSLTTLSLLLTEQISVAIKKFNIDHLLVHCSKHVQIKDLKKEYQRHFSIAFGNGIREMSESVGHDSYWVSQIKPINSKHLGLNFIYNPAKLRKTRLIVPQFRGRKLVKGYYIDEFSLLSQLTYGTSIDKFSPGVRSSPNKSIGFLAIVVDSSAPLVFTHVHFYFVYLAILPQCGFEWNINDRVLCMNSLSSVLGILELLTTFLVGAQIVVNWRYRSQAKYVNEFCNLLQRYKITTCILHSYYLTDLIKSNLTLSGSLKKILYTQQPLHKNVVKAFKQRFGIRNCRFVFYFVEASGFAAIEVFSHEDDVSTSVTPLPSMEMLIVDRQSGKVCPDGKLGKIFVRSPYCAKSGKARWRDGWIFSGFIGFSEDTTRLQVIDHHGHFLQLGRTFVSKSLVETILLSHPAVIAAVVLKHLDGHDKTFRALVQLESREQCDASELAELIKTHLKEDKIKVRWRVCIVRRLRRDTSRHRIWTRQVRLGAITTTVGKQRIESDSSTEYL